MEEMPTFGIQEVPTCLPRVAKIKGKVKLLFDIDRLLSHHELTVLANAQA